MWPIRVVMAAPGFNLAPCVEEIPEPTDVEAFLTQAAVEALDISVLDRLAGPDVH